MAMTPIPDDTIEVWPFLLDETPERFESLTQSLAPEERNKIDQGIFPEIGHRSAVSRAGLRNILASYLEISPKEIALQEGEHGKPTLAGEEISFNLSHTGKFALLVASNEGQLGVDLERIRAEAPIEDLAQRCFSSDEQKQWNNYSGEQQLNSFFHLWAQKEAFLKAHGGGMTIPLKDFDCLADPEEKEGVIRSRLSGDSDETWRVIAGEKGQDLRYSIVWNGTSKSICYRNPEEAELSRW